MGFEPFGYKGLETGSREIVSHAVKQDKVSTGNTVERKIYKGCCNLRACAMHIKITVVVFSLVNLKCQWSKK